MITFNKLINEAIQRTPILKNKIKVLQREFENEFGNKLYSNKFDYNVEIEDLKKIFILANKWFFQNKLDINKLEFIIIKNLSNHKEKGTFLLGEDNYHKHKLGIIKYDKDNLFQIINVVIHEMIHFYDLEYGDLKDKATEYYVNNIHTNQYVGNYDVHGKYFQKWCDKINKHGFEVKKTYNINKDKLAMKKILEKHRETHDFFDNKTKNDDQKYQQIKAFYDSLINCNKDMVYRDAKHWYIQID